MTDTSNSRTPMYSEREHQLARVQGSKGNESVRFKSSMSPRNNLNATSGEEKY